MIYIFGTQTHLGKETFFDAHVLIHFFSHFCQYDIEKAIQDRILTFICCLFLMTQQAYFFWQFPYCVYEQYY